MADRREQPYSDRVVLGPLLRDLARFHGGTEAVVTAGSRLTYADLDRSSAELARQLIAVGVGKGTRVGILLPNGTAWVRWFAAVGRIGGLALPISTLAQAPELRWLLRAAGIDLVVTAPAFHGHDYLARFEEAVPGLAAAHGDRPLLLESAPRLRHVFVADDAGPSGAPPWVATMPDLGREVVSVDPDLLARVEEDVVPHDPLVVIHTSGSTTDPKGVVHGHGNLIGHTGTMARDYVPQAAGDRLSSPRPWFWVAGLAADLFYALHSGSTFVVPADGTPETMAALVRDERLDLVGGSLPLFRRLATDATLAEAGLACLPLGIDLAGVAEDAGAGVRFRSTSLERAVPASTAATFVVWRFPNLFGMTESIGSHSTLPHGTQVPEGREGASGPPVPGIEHRVVDPVTRQEVPPGVEGELLIRGRSLMVGLDRLPPAEVFDEGGWYATGDVCIRDADGWITFRSRLGDMVKISGANVAPLEVERAMLGHEAIEEVAVVGTGGPEGPVLVAYVVLGDGAVLEAADLEAWLRSRLSSYKVPRRYVFVDREDLPRTPSGKVRKHVLRERG